MCHEHDFCDYIYQKEFYIGLSVSNRATTRPEINLHAGEGLSILEIKVKAHKGKGSCILQAQWLCGPAVGLCVTNSSHIRCPRR